MSDLHEFTPETAISVLAEHLASGTPPIGEAETVLWTQARELALGAAYTWLNGDFEAQTEFLEQIIDLGEGGAGVTFAIELFSALRLFGVSAGMLRDDTEITTRWAPAEHLSEEKLALYRSCIELITDLWSGMASRDYPRAVVARNRLWTASLDDVREVLRIMAFDAAVALECFSIWNGTGCDTWGDYRRAHPVPGKWESA